MDSAERTRARSSREIFIDCRPRRRPRRAGGSSNLIAATPVQLEGREAVLTIRRLQAKETQAQIEELDSGAAGGGPLIMLGGASAIHGRAHRR